MPNSDIISYGADKTITMCCFNCGFIQEIDVPKDTIFVPSSITCSECSNNSWLWDWNIP